MLPHVEQIFSEGAKQRADGGPLWIVTWAPAVLGRPIRLTQAGRYTCCTRSTSERHTGHDWGDTKRSRYS